MLEKPLSPKAVQEPALKKGLLTHLENIYYMTIKELRSIRADYIILILVLYTFTIAVYTIATGASTNPQNLTLGVVDEDHSNLSRQFLDVMNRPPLFKRAVLIKANEIDPIMNAGTMIFVLEIAPRFEEDLLAGRKVSLQLNVDATAMAPAGNGAMYIQTVIMQEINNFMASSEMPLPSPVNLVIRAKFNPQFYSNSSAKPSRPSPRPSWRTSGGRRPVGGRYKSPTVRHERPLMARKRARLLCSPGARRHRLRAVLRADHQGDRRARRQRRSWDHGRGQLDRRTAASLGAEHHRRDAR